MLYNPAVYSDKSDYLAHSQPSAATGPLLPPNDKQYSHEELLNLVEQSGRNTRFLLLMEDSRHENIK